MKDYETVILMKPNLSKSKMENIITRVENKIRKFGNITRKQDLGEKKLAYKIKENDKGYYIVYQFKAKSRARKSLESFYKTIDEIIRYIIIDKEEE
ncbi:MAG: 30S ribosomal protein S6 [Clostridia bacterium]|nr:30S ribosomal protein S6 [Clostridia bacterium]